MDDADPGSPDLKIELDPRRDRRRAARPSGMVPRGAPPAGAPPRAGGRPIRRSRSERLLDSASRMQQNLASRRVANERYEHYRATAG